MMNVTKLLFYIESFYDFCLVIFFRCPESHQNEICKSTDYASNHKAPIKIEKTCYCTCYIRNKSSGIIVFGI